MSKVVPHRASRRQLPAWLRLALIVLLLLPFAYLILAYVLAPLLLRHFERQPALAATPKVTLTSLNLPGDPLNVALIGSQDEVIRALLAAKWAPADPITYRSALRIAASVVFRRPDPDAPVSNLFLFGRRQDLAFEKEIGKSAAQRNHVRLWQTDLHDADGRPIWVGAATLDVGVELSHYTGEITHRIGPDIDGERDLLMQDLSNAGQLVELYDVTGVGATLNGRNGGGDRYYTDGEQTVGVIAPSNATQTTSPPRLSSPPLVEIKNQFWSWVTSLNG